MIGQQRLKRRLVRELVRDNERLISGERAPGRVSRQRSRRWPVPLVVLGAVLLTGFAVVQSGALPWVAKPVTAAVSTSGSDGTNVTGTDSNRSNSGLSSSGSSSSLRPMGAFDGTSFEDRLSEALFVAPAPVDLQAFPLTVRRVMIDPGHGGGNVGTSVPSGLEEKFITLDLAKRLRDLLVEEGFEVFLTREDDRDIDLERRAAYATEVGADVFISIHVNWIEGRRARGVETYHLGPSNDPLITRLAASENRDSGYSLADLRGLLDRIYADVRHQHSAGLARSVHESLYGSLKKVTPDLADRGVKTAPFIVLATTEIPAILAEVASLSDQEEAELLGKPLYRQYIAEALAEGIESFAVTMTDVVPEGTEKGTES